MSLYHEMPKKSITTALKKRYSNRELETVSPEIYDLLQSCHTLNQLHEQLLEILKRKQSQHEFSQIHEPDLLSI